MERVELQRDRGRTQYIGVVFRWNFATGSGAVELLNYHIPERVVFINASAICDGKPAGRACACPVKPIKDFEIMGKEVKLRLCVGDGTKDRVEARSRTILYANGKAVNSWYKCLRCDNGHYGEDNVDGSCYGMNCT